MKSHVAGIIDSYGGLRVVVALQETFRHHVIGDEMLFVVPGLRVREPVPWHRVPSLIRQVERFIDRWIATRNDPDDIEHGPIKLYQLRRSRTYQRGAVNLFDIVET